MPEEVEEKSDNDEEETSKQPKRTGRRREGTMNKSFKFPPDPTPSGAPPVPDIPKDLPGATQKQKPSAEGRRARKSVGSDEVAAVTPSDVEVPPPPPTEKEQAASSVSDLDELGETEEISLN